MTKETKISITILVFGFLAIATYWFMGEKKVYILEDERIVLTKNSADFFKKLPLVKDYLDDIEKHFKKYQAVLPLEDLELDNKAKKVQGFLLKNKEFLKDTRTKNGQLLHNDMMTIRPAIMSVLNVNSQKICKKFECYQAINYNFVTYTTTRAIVDANSNRLL